MSPLPSDMTIAWRSMVTSRTHACPSFAGATAKLRSLKNTEKEQLELERSALTLDQGVVLPPDFGRIKRVDWLPPAVDRANLLLNRTQPRMRDASTRTAWKYPLFKTLTGVCAWFSLSLSLSLSLCAIRSSLPPPLLSHPHCAPTPSPCRPVVLCHGIPWPAWAL